MTLTNTDCIEVMKGMDNCTVDFTLTNIPYDVVNRECNGLRLLNKSKADVLGFDLYTFLYEVLKVTRNSICIFCSKEQFSFIYSFFAAEKGIVRPIIWQKTNPISINGQYVYLNGVEMAVWFKKSGAHTFNAHCKNTVFAYPDRSNKTYPTEKNHDLLGELILDNTNEDDIVFDPCMGFGSTGIIAKSLKRDYYGIEIEPKWFNIAKKRIEESICIETLTKKKSFNI